MVLKIVCKGKKSEFFALLPMEKKILGFLDGGYGATGNLFYFLLCAFTCCVDKKNKSKHFLWKKLQSCQPTIPLEGIARATED